MDHYLDLRIRPDPEFPPQQLLNALYAKLHRALVAHSDWQIAVAFPEWKPTHLGKLLRLVASHHDLDALMRGEWLRGMRDHVEIGTMDAVPADARHRRLVRVQAKSSAERLRRRAMKRHQLTPEQARERIPDSVEELLMLPSVYLQSSSSGQSFRLFLRHEPLQAEPSNGRFNAYGLSQTASIPWF